MAIPQYVETFPANADAHTRAGFIRKTYVHLAGAVAAFIALEALLLSSPLAPVITRSLLGTRFGWMLALAAFMFVGWMAQKWARSSTSVGMQYLGLGLYVVAEAFLMVPLLFIAASMGGGATLILQAAVYTGFIFTGLTFTVFFMGADFSFMRGALTVGGFAALGVIVVSMIFGFSLGAFFFGAMILLAAGYILYETSNVLHHYPVGFHVAAALALFASVALMFWYVLQLLMSLNRR